MHVEILFCRFVTSHVLVLVSAHSNLLFQIFQCGLGGIFWLDGLVFWWVFQIHGFPLVASFFASDWNLHVINSHVVGATVGVS